MQELGGKEWGTKLVDGTVTGACRLAYYNSNASTNM